MTRKLYDENSHLQQFEAVVLSCEPEGEKYKVVLDCTAFFPEGGGQASDRGTLGGALVLDVQIIDEEIYHFTDKPLEVGSAVQGELDWQRRFDYMQQHSGEHIVSGIAHKLYGCENVGFHLGDDIVTLDFDKYLEREQILQIEKQANEAVYKNVHFYTYYPDEEKLKTLCYRSKKEIDGAVRIVEIEDTDMCACCAPHVNVSGEIGAIKLLDSERLRGGVRIELKCGMRALDDYNEKYRNTAAIGALLSVKQNETAPAVEKLNSLLAAEKQQKTALKKRLAEAMIISAGEEPVFFAEDLDIKELQLLADGLHKKTGKLHAVFSPVSQGFAFAFCGDAAETDEVFANFKKSNQVRGGGRNGLVQGTVSATKEQIKLFFHI